ncbi:MAG: molybdopterin-binding protein [Nitriliruptoraceae bacterium]
MFEASMLVIGDELLGGYVTDANSPLLAQRLRTHGVALTRIHVVPDDMAAIDEGLSTELARARPRLIVTSGGVGSTPDDITFEAVAASLGRGLVEDAALATRMDEIAARARDDGFPVDDAYVAALKRMANVPDGSRRHTGQRSWVPAVAIDVDGGSDNGGATVVILPGVPRLFAELVDDVVVPELVAGRNPVPEVVEIAHWLPESALNHVFAELVTRFEDVSLGSYPGRPMLVRLTGPSNAVAAAAARVREEIASLEANESVARLVRARRADAASA